MIDMNSESNTSGPTLSDQLEQDLVEIFKLLADETRLKLLMHLVREGQMHVTEMCERLKFAQPAISHHLKLLLKAGIIEVRKDGRHNFYSVKKSRFHGMIGQLFETFKESKESKELRFKDFVVAQEA